MLRAAAEQFGGKEESEIAKGKETREFNYRGSFAPVDIQAIGLSLRHKYNEKVKGGLLPESFSIGSNPQNNVQIHYTDRKDAQDSDLALSAIVENFMRISHFYQRKV